MAKSAQSSCSETPRVLCVGPMSMDLLQFEVDGSEFFYPGGNAVIFSSVLSEMGMDCSVLGQVGSDPDGDQIVRCLQRHKVSTALLRRESSLQTKVGRNLVSIDGEWKRLSSKPAIVAYMSPEQACIDVSDYTHLHVGGLHGLLRSARDVTLSVLNACIDRGLTISVGLASGEVDSSDLNAGVPKGAFVFCTLSEFRHLLLARGLRASDPLEQLLEMGVGNCVITLGAAGSVAILDSTVIYVVDATGAHLRRSRVEASEDIRRFVRRHTWHEGPRRPVASVNAVGAGDVFSAVFEAGVLGGYPSERALCAAAKAASLSVTDRTWDAWISRATCVEDLLGS